MKDDTRLYINCMEEVRYRVNLVKSVGESEPRVVAGFVESPAVKVAVCESLWHK